MRMSPKMTDITLFPSCATETLRGFSSYTHFVYSLIAIRMMAINKLLSNEVAETIKNYIKENKLQIGNKLPNEMELSTMLDVSRITVREAVKILSGKGVVEI